MQSQGARKWVSQHICSDFMHCMCKCTCFPSLFGTGWIISLHPFLKMWETCPTQARHLPLKLSGHRIQSFEIHRWFGQFDSAPEFTMFRMKEQWHPISPQWLNPEFPAANFNSYLGCDCQMVNSSKIHVGGPPRKSMRGRCLTQCLVIIDASAQLAAFHPTFSQFGPLTGGLSRRKCLAEILCFSCQVTVVHMIRWI